MIQDITPFIATHPGEVLKDELDARGIRQNDFAKEIDVQKSFLNEIVNGKRPVTADLAIVLEKALGISADYWMKFQSQYEIDKARLKEKNLQRIKNIDIWNFIKELVPVNNFKKLGYLTNSIETDIKRIKEIYDVALIDDLIAKFSSHKSLSLYRKSEKLLIDEKNMFAWNSIAKYEASQQKVNAFHSENMKALKKELGLIFYENQDVIELVKKKLKQYGIKLVLIEKFDKTPIDGVSFWSGDNPAIGLTLRHKRIDNFAFTVLHELGHIELHLTRHKERSFIDIKKNKIEDHFEKEANQYAQDALIPSDIWQAIKATSSLSDDVILAYAKQYKIHPAIILGRLCWEKSSFARKTKINKELL